MSSVVCQKLRETLINHQNNLQKVRPQIHRLKKRKDALEDSMREVVTNLRRTEQQQLVGGFSDLLGFRGRITGLGLITEAEIRKGRLQDELSKLRNQLDHVNIKLEDLEEDERRYVFGIPKTKNELERLGCDSR